MKPKASGQLDRQEIHTQPISQNCKSMKNDRETYCKNTSNDLRNYQKTRSYPDYAPKGLRLVEVGQFFYALPSSKREANHASCREYTLPRDQTGTRMKGWIRSNVRFGPVSDIKVCNQYERDGVEVQVQSLLKDLTES